MLSVIIGFIVWAIIDNKRVGALFQDFVEWIKDNGAVGPIVLACVYVVSTVLFLPGLILTLGAGFAFN